jgi:peptide/nickel transport system substrate-binding protein
MMNTNPYGPDPASTRSFGRRADPASIRHLSRRAFIRGAAVIGASAAFGGLLAACSPTPAAQPTAAARPAAAPTTAPAAPAAPASAATTAPASTQSPKPGGQSVWAQLTDPVSFDPHKAGGDSQAEILQQFYASLATYNDKLEATPSLALSWDNPDPQTYVFKLRQGVKFHDGNEMTADDVKYSIERMIAKETANPWKFTIDSIDQVTVADKYTVKIATNRPDAGLPAAMAMNRGTAIIPADGASKTDLNLKANGTGPFRMVEYVPADHIIFEKFPDYWGKPIPYLDRVTYKILGDEEARVAGLRAKQFDASQIATDSVQRLSSDNTIQILKSAIYSPYTLEPNSGKAPTSDVRVRKAISLAVDRNVYLDKVVGGFGVLTGPIGTGYGDWFIPPEQLGYKYDPDQAKALLADAGVAPGTQLSFPYQGDNPFYTAIAVVTADMLKKVGLDVKLEALEAGVLNTRGPSGSRDYHFFSRRRGFRSDPDGHLRADFYSSGPSNPGYKNAEVDDLLDKARIELDHATRKQMYTRIQQIILDENPHIFLFNALKLDALQGYVQGYTPAYTGFRESLRQTWLAK